MTLLATAGGRLPVAPHVWLVLLGAAVLASSAAVLGARSRLTVAGTVAGAGVAAAGVAVLAGSELVAVGLAVVMALVGCGSLVAAAAPPMPRNVLRAGGAGIVFAVITIAATVSAVGTSRVARTVPATAATLARPLYLGGALVVDGCALVVLVLLVAVRRRPPAGDA